MKLQPHTRSRYKLAIIIHDMPTLEPGLFIGLEGKPKCGFPLFLSPFCARLILPRSTRQKNSQLRARTSHHIRSLLLVPISTTHWDGCVHSSLSSRQPALIALLYSPPSLTTIISTDTHDPYHHGQQRQHAGRRR
jgi:hypothetical protein